MQAMSRSYLQCVRTKTETDSELQHSNLKMKTSISTSSQLLISLLSLLVRTVCHWVELEQPSLLIAQSLSSLTSFFLLLSLWCMVYSALSHITYRVCNNMASYKKWLCKRPSVVRPSQYMHHCSFSLFTINSVLYYFINIHTICHSGSALTTVKNKKKRPEIYCTHLFPSRWLLISGSILNQDISLLIMASSQLLHIENKSLTLLI